MYRKGIRKIETPSVARIEAVTPRIIVTDRRQPAVGQRRREQRLTAFAQGPASAGAQVVTARPRRHALFPQRAAPVLRPVQRTVVQHRRRIDASRPEQPAFAACPRIDRHDAARLVHIAFQRQQRRIVQRHRGIVDRITGNRRRQRFAAVRFDGLRTPEPSQLVERVARDLVDRRAVVLMQRPLRRQNGIGIFRTVFRDPRPHIVPVLFARPGGQLITELVVIRNIILIGTAKPLVEREFLRPFGQVGAVFDRKRGLQRTAERRHLRLVHHSVPFEEPDRQQHRTKQTRLLSDHVTDPFHEPPVQVAVLYGVPVFVGYQLL